MQSLNLLVVMVTACLILQTNQKSNTPIDQPNDLRYNSEIRNYVNSEISLMQKNTRIVFLGASIQQYWTTNGQVTWNQNYVQRYNAWDYGVAGDIIQNVLFRLERPELTQISPELVVLLVGNNNINADNADADQIHVGISAILQQLEIIWPETKVLLNTLWNSVNQEITMQSNQYLFNLVDNKRIFIADSAQVFKDGSDLIDGLHPNAVGYVKWSMFLEPFIQSLVPAQQTDVQLF